MKRAVSGQTNVGPLEEGVAARKWAACGAVAAMVGLTLVAALATGASRSAAQTARVAANLSDGYQDARFLAASASAEHTRFMLDDSVATVTPARAALAAVARTPDRLNELPGSLPSAVSEIQDLVDRYRTTSARAEHLMLSHAWAAAARVDRTEFEPASSALIERLGQFEERAHLHSEAELRRASASADRVWVIVPAVLVLTLVLAMLIISMLRRDRRRMTSLALTDALTGLPNRLALAEGARALDESPLRPTSLILLDLDRFKEVNDGLGHQFGDELLMQVSQRLQRAVKANDLVVRLGGDEFAVLLPDSDESVAQGVAERIRGLIGTPFVLDGATVEIGVSTGIVSTATVGTELATLLRCADIALYTAKETRGGIEIYRAEQDLPARARIQTISELLGAFDRDELEMHYQPKIALDDGRLLGVEALIRWRHPQRGLLGPFEFLPLIEDTEMMDRLTVLALSKALQQHRRWAEAGHSIPVAVNVSARSLLDLTFPTTVETLLNRFGVPAPLLCIEITESSVLRNVDRCVAVLTALRTIGVRISIDDYGTGYASMSYLQNLPVDELKIDRSYVSRIAEDPQTAVLTRSVVELGHNLGLSVVAEGVESDVVEQLLQSAGCDVAQGYLYARPMPANDILDWKAAAPSAATSHIPVQRDMRSAVNS